MKKVYVKGNKKSYNKKRYNKADKNIQNMAILCLALVFIITGCIVFTNAQVAAMDRVITEQKETIDKLKNKKLVLDVKLKGKKGSIDIQSEAMYRLGMVVPNENQIVYVETEKKNNNKDVNYNVFLSPIVSVLRSFNKD